MGQGQLGEGAALASRFKNRVVPEPLFPLTFLHDPAWTPSLKEAFFAVGLVGVALAPPR